MKITSRPGRLLVSLLLLALSLAATAAERTVYFVNDAQGSPVAAMDQQGEVLWRESYAPYGERRTKAADNTGKPAYTGKPEDTETSLVYMHARMYDPETARFTGIDPVGFRMDSLQSFNRYLYGANSPYLYVDPDGREEVNFGELGEQLVQRARTDRAEYGRRVEAELGDAGELAVGTAATAAAAMLVGRGIGGANKTIPSTAGVVRRFEQVGDKTYYRVFSGDAKEGSWLTAVPPKSSAWAREALALPPGNKATMIQEVLVPSGTLLERSRAKRVDGWGKGGAEQFRLLEAIPSANYGPGRPLK